MHIRQMHKEDIKAAIRKRFRSIAEFERHFGLARQSVTEVLRGRSSKATEDAIRQLLIDTSSEAPIQSIIAVHNHGEAAAHPQMCESQ